MELCVHAGSIVSRFGLEAGYRMIREAGFDGVDWTLDSALDCGAPLKKQKPPCIFLRPFDEVLDHYREELAQIRASGLKLLIAHAPFPTYVRDFPEYSPYIIPILKQCVRLCGRVGVPHLVVHGATVANWDGTNPTPRQLREANERLYESLIPELLECDTVVCVENLSQQRSAEESARFVDELNEKAGKSCFAFCVDTGHLNLNGVEPAPFLRTLGSRVQALHLHDNRGAADEHLAPYAGKVPWDDVLGALKEIGYAGALNFETIGQVSPKRMGPEFVPLWLKLIAETGKIWRTELASPVR